MLSQFRGSLTYANVMATLAVFLGLAGGAYAVTNVPDANGVFHGCVSKANGALRVVSSSHACHPSVRRNGRTLSPGEFAISWNAQGRPGHQGLQGIPGVNGATNAVVRTTTVTGLISGTQVVRCNAGERAIGGGAAPSDLGSLDHLFVSAPTTTGDGLATNGSTPTGWMSGVQNTSGTDTTFYAVCASP